MEKRKNVILFTGEASEPLRKHLSAWTGAFVAKHGETNAAKIRVADATGAQIVSELLSVPFFAEKRLVVLDGMPRSATRSAAGGEESETAAETVAEAPPGGDDAEAAVLSVFGSIPDSTVAVFVSETPNTKSVLYKRLLEEGEVKAFGGLTAQTAREYVRERLPGITDRAVRALVDATASNPERWSDEPAKPDDRKLRSLVEKLSLGYGEAKIDLKELSEAEEFGSDAKAYSLPDPILAGDAEAVLKSAREILAKDSPFTVFPTVATMVRKRLHAETLRRFGAGEGEIQKATGMTAAQLSRAKGDETRYRAAKAAYASLVRFEAAWRTGNAPGKDDAEAVENALLSAALAAKKASSGQGG